MSSILTASSLAGQHDVTDGPYVFSPQGQPARASWVCHGEHLQRTLDANYVMRPDNCGNLPQPSLHQLKNQVDADSFQDVETIVALSDVHGQYDVLLHLLRNQGVVDQHNNWALGKAHLVITGDMFDRGPQVNEVLWLVYQLDKQARDAGGQLHLLMGNHEQMVLKGDLRYVNPRYQVAETLIGRNYDALYGTDTELGQWLRSKHTLVKINDILFMHGGISPEWLQTDLTISSANALYREHIDTPKEQIKQSELLNFLFYKNGPTWYRGYFKDELSDGQIDKLLAHFGVSHIVVGHTSQDRVLGLYDNKIVAIDSSIKNGQSGELLWIEQGKLSRGLYDGGKAELTSD
ncbi:metallophosphoesterase [Shewanella sp. GXUN23E]|uniref:metallophosphoesterase n=1 Tax=Shewanella sp. GXUN23E TaxID=3422498 RepID=UPI003D7F13B2